MQRGLVKVARAGSGRYVEDYIAAVTRRRPLRSVILSSWETPATAYPRASVGRAAIARYSYGRGFYLAYGTAGGAGPVDFFKVPGGRRLPVTTLKIDGRTWMIDDPPHWWSIRETARRLRGRVLIGGLGLGLILWAAAENPEVERAVVIERDADVIALMLPNLPKRPAIEIVEDDFAGYLDRAGRFDSAFVDLWVTYGHEEGRRLFAEEVLPLALRVFEKTGAKMHTLGFIGSEALP